MFKIIVCDKERGYLFETTANTIDEFVIGMVRLGYKDFLIRSSGFFMSDEYFCIIN